MTAHLVRLVQMDDLLGFEPGTTAPKADVLPLHYRSVWWRITDSNCLPIACKAIALPDELNPHGTQTGVKPVHLSD